MSKSQTLFLKIDSRPSFVCCTFWDLFGLIVGYQKAQSILGWAFSCFKPNIF